MKRHIKLSQWAKNNGYSYGGAYNLYRTKGIVGSIKLPSGTILVRDDDSVKNDMEDYTVIYSRVSSSENRPNLDSQASRILKFCTSKGWTVKEVVKECASGMDDKRPKLQKILSNDKISRIVVEHKDRLTRFGFEYIKTLFKGEIVVINEVDNDEKDLMQDFISIITSFCARIYGKRRCGRKTEKIIKELQNDDQIE